MHLMFHHLHGEKLTAISSQIFSFFCGKFVTFQYKNYAPIQGWLRIRIKLYTALLSIHQSMAPSASPRPYKNLIFRHKFSPFHSSVTLLRVLFSQQYAILIYIERSQEHINFYLIRLEHPSFRTVSPIIGMFYQLQSYHAKRQHVSYFFTNQLRPTKTITHILYRLYAFSVHSLCFYLPQYLLGI